MVMERAAQLPEGAEWQYEYSWPGERVLAIKRETSVQLVTAAHRRDLTNRFPVIVAAMAKLNATYVVIDGVIRSIEPAQAAVFSEPIVIVPGGSAEVRLIATDVLWINECDVRQQSLANRKHQLAQLVAGSGILANLPLEHSPDEVLQEGRCVGADAVLAKRRDSRYRPFARTGDWVRVGCAAATGAMATSNSSRPSPSTGARDSGPFGAGWGTAIS
jgi:bifunctional non-homologous end joining protein LigD